MRTIAIVRASVFVFVLFTAQLLFAQVFVPDSDIRNPHRPPDFAPYAWNAVEIQSTRVTTKIRDQIAQTKVEQVLYNPNAQQMEGSLLFPVPRGAQLDKFTMEIDGKMVEAELLKSGKARGIYEEIVRKMKDPALLEYADRDLFKLRIFPIPAHAEKRVTFSYTQVLTRDSGLVSYAFPLNTTRFSTKPLKNVSVKVELESTQPLKSIYSPSHKVDVRRHGQDRATIGFETADAKCESDFELFYKADADELAANLMTYKCGDDDGYFLMLLSPGVVGKNHAVMPKDVTFVIDTSGSMQGNKIKQARKALEYCVESLNDGDRFEVIRFSTEVEPLFNDLRKVSDASRKEAQTFIKDLHATGSTALGAALVAALNARPHDSERPYLVIFLTDGLPTVGVSDEATIVEHTREGSGGSTRVFCFGVGYDVNTRLLDRIAEETRAVTQYVLPEEDIEAKVSTFFAKVKEPVLANPKLHFPDNAHVSKLYPSPLLDLFSGEQLVLVGRYAHASSGKVVLEGTVNGTTKKFRYDVDFSTDEQHDFIPRLWATRRIGYLLDEIRLHGENSETRDEVTALARKYGIVTPYTAYLIVDDEKKRNVPVAMRSMRTLDLDGPAMKQGEQLYDRYKKDISGQAAVANSQYNLNFKTADNASSAATDNRALGSAQAEGTTFAISAPATVSAPRGVAAGNILAHANQSAQQTRFVAGKNFFINGNQWLDTDVQNATKAQRVRIQFNSKQYFDLARTNKQALPWLAQGNNVQFVQNGLVYEIYP
ncbi:MAG: vault protein inter-alpha-trypsin protein [Verrucomicrobiales bacterium]|nr:vault protein inter-alpha-trypsin protein [Verrucomicrobiales bacterium]